MSRYPVAVAALGALCLTLMTTACSDGPQEASTVTPPVGESASGDRQAIAVKSDLVLPETLEGGFQIIAMRRASETAAPAELDGAASSPLGKTVIIDADRITLPGRVCAPASIDPGTGAEVLSADPMLADLHLPPLDGRQPPQGVLHRITCADGDTLEIYQSDPRAIAIPWQNGAAYLVAERPMTNENIIGLQTVLGDMKFINGEPSGTWDGAALIGLRAYYDYRDTSEPGYVFERPAITASLLEKIGPSGE